MKAASSAQKTVAVPISKDSQSNVSTGPFCIFTTGDFLPIDDFESYTDDGVAGETIWQTRIDGFNVADNGAQVGNLIPPYCEQTIVRGGAQSMPLFYVNETGITAMGSTGTMFIDDIRLF